MGPNIKDLRSRIYLSCKKIIIYASYIAPITN